MILAEVTIEGTLREDGTVALDKKPDLPPGRVTVVLRQETAATGPSDNWFEYMVGARRKLEQAGSHFMDEAELQAHVDWLREGDRIDDMLGELDRHDREPGRSGC
jgi:hypothetical protein